MRIISILILLLSFGIPFSVKGDCSAVELSLDFNVNDFSFVYNQDKHLSIESTKCEVNYCRDFTTPCLPFVKYSLVIPPNQCLSEISIKSYQSQIIMNDVILCDAPNFVPTSVTFTNLTNCRSYIDGIYPINPIKDKWSGDVGGYNIVSFSVCPFAYDTTTQELIFKPNIEINVELKQSSKLTKYKSPSDNNDFDKILRPIVLNPEGFDKYYPNKVAQKSLVNEDDLYDYVIITSENLKHAFEPLVEWKRIKGLNCRIVTTEEIEKHYSATSKELKIKKCILDLSFDNGVNYVLLGGDIDIIPAVYCYCSIPGYKDKNADKEYILDFDDLPADLYYGTTNGDIDWDANNNGIRGELADNVDFTPYIYVTRLPVNFEEEVKCIVDKILFYEQTPDYNGWENRIFMSGCKLKADHNKYGRKYSDAELQADMLYSNSFKNMWNGKRIKYFDTSSDLSSKPPIKLDASIINNQLVEGYAFVDMISHGESTGWTVDESLNGATFYNNVNANELVSYQPTLITTVSCHTNAFDKNRDSYTKVVAPPSNFKAKCLSESFLLNQKCNVFAYFGSSREGWSDKASINYGFGPSNEYVSKFYQLLFDETQTNKSFGALANLAKASKIVDSQIYNPYRWLQFTLNPLGDPEMQIYPSAPKHFQNGRISIKDNQLSIGVEELDCSFCLYEFFENGMKSSRLRRRTNAAYFEIPTGEGIICVTKGGYTPFFAYFKDDTIYLQNDVISQNWIIDCKSIKIGYNVTPDKRSGGFKVLSGQIDLNAESVVLDAGTYVAAGAIINIKNK